MSFDKNDSRQRQLNEIIAEFLKATEDGHEPNREQWIEKNAEFTDDLKLFLLNHDVMPAKYSKKATSAPIQPTEDETIPPSVPEEATIAPIPEDDATLPPTKAAPDGSTMARSFGDYELLEEIARGGMGVVYKARQTRLNRIVALKMILAGQLAGDEDIKRFHAEAEAAANLDHPGIVPIYEIGEHEGQHFFSMGFVEGESLANRINGGPLPLREAAECTKKIADAVAFAHERGVIHRDLKPANVLLDRHNEPRVTDFGLAKKLDDDSGLTATGQILGTPSYMPPEQASGRTDEVTESADVYSLGAILYALVTGRPPFQAASPMDTLMQVLDQPPVPPRQFNRNIDLDIQTIALKCLEKDPKHRYETASDLSRELEEYLGGRPITARPVGPIQRVWRKVRRHPRATGLLAIGLAIVVLLSVVGYFSGRSNAAKLTEDDVNTLVSEAAGARLQDVNRVFGSERIPPLSSFEDQRLSLVLICAFIEAGAGSPGSLHEECGLEILAERPSATQVIQALTATAHKGYASLIRPENVTACVFSQGSETMGGTVEFTEPNLCSGKVEFIARRQDDRWIVETLVMHRLRLTRDRDGSWHAH